MLQRRKREGMASGVTKGGKEGKEPCRPAVSFEKISGGKGGKKAILYLSIEERAKCTARVTIDKEGEEENHLSSGGGGGNGTRYLRLERKGSQRERRRQLHNLGGKGVSRGDDGVELLLIRWGGENRSL